MALTNLAKSEDICEYFMYCPGRGTINRSGSRSIPSTSTAASLNPANIAQVRGLGIESTFQSSNSPLYSFVSGSGKIGALISPSQENSFFGNRPIEIDEVYAQRKMAFKQYKNDKLNLALGANLFNGKNIGVDFGASLKRNPDLKVLNPGVALNARFSLLTLGLYYTQDDVLVNLSTFINPYNGTSYSTLYNGLTYKEKFNMLAITSGIQYENFTADFGYIKTKYKFYSEDTEIQLLSFSYVRKKLMFTIAKRIEYSPNMIFANNSLFFQRKKIENFLGLQYLQNKHLLFGLSYNNFLLNELSASVTLFW